MNSLPYSEVWILPRAADPYNCSQIQVNVSWREVCSYFAQSLDNMYRWSLVIHLKLTFAWNFNQVKLMMIHWVVILNASSPLESV